MAALIAYARGDAGRASAHRLGTRYASAEVATHSRRAEVTLWRDGRGRLEVRDESGRIVASVDWPAESEPLALEVTR